jgi:2-polyprenyl-3-methyl-5-hydroxy-6-metoxy-1,4-benzoquinol methylase
MKRRIYSAPTRLALRLHNFSYKLATKLAIRAEDGLHPKHRLTNYHRFFLDNINIGDEVLDSGRGNGALTRDLAKKAKFVLGIDVNERNVEMARNRYNAKNVEYRVADATTNLESEKYDVIVLSNILEHLENRNEFLNKVRKLGPKVLIRVPMVNRDWTTLYKKELGVEWRLDKTHSTEYSLESFNEELEKAGLNLEKYSIQFGEIWAVVR